MINAPEEDAFADVSGIGVFGSPAHGGIGARDAFDYPPGCRGRDLVVHGYVDAGEVLATLAAHDVLLLPTRGENFGHVILESLLSGCPVLISDRTPWRGLESQGVGWDLPLEDLPRLRQAVQRLVDMGPEQHAELSWAARRYGVAYVNDEETLERNRALFLNAH